MDGSDRRRRVSYAVSLILCACLGVGMLAAAVQQPAPSPSHALSSFHAKTEAQHIVAKLFDDPYSGPLKPNSVKVDDREEGLLSRPLDEEGFIRTSVCRSDAVVLGRPISSQSLLTPRESSIFTEYNVGVEEWLRGSAGDRSRPRANTSIQVALLGGRLDTSLGLLAVAGDPPLALNQEYVLFLKSIPGTSSYHLSGPAVLVADGTVKAIKGNRQAPSTLLKGEMQAGALFGDIRQAARGCIAAGGGP